MRAFTHKERRDAMIFNFVLSVIIIYGLILLQVPIIITFTVAVLLSLLMIGLMSVHFQLKRAEEIFQHDVEMLMLIGGRDAANKIRTEAVIGAERAESEYLTDRTNDSNRMKHYLAQHTLEIVNRAYKTTIERLDRKEAES